MKSNWYWRVFPGGENCLSSTSKFFSFQIILNHRKNSVLTPQGVCSWHKMANFFYCQNFLPDLKGVFSRDWPGISSPPAITWYRNHTIYTRSVFLWWSKMHLKDFLRNCKKMMMMMTMMMMVMIIIIIIDHVNAKRRSAVTFKGDFLSVWNFFKRAAEETSSSRFILQVWSEIALEIYILISSFKILQLS